MDQSFIDALKTLGADPATIAVIVVGSAALTFSKRVAAIKGPIGAIARWFYSRRERNVERREKDERERVRRDSAAYRALERKLNQLDRQAQRQEKQIAEMRDHFDDQLRAKNDYIVALLGFIHRMRMRAADNGVIIDAPPEEGAQP